MGTKGLILKTTDGGTTWDSIKVDSNEDFFQVVSDEKHIILVSNFRNIYASRNNGAFRRVRFEPKKQISGVLIVDKTLLILTHDSMIYRKPLSEIFN